MAGDLTTIPLDVPAFGAMLARAYQEHWRDHSLMVAKQFPRICKEFDITGNRLADLACGEGTFAVGMARQGYHVYGVDQSPDMLNLAIAQSRRRKVNVDWLRQDIRELNLPEPVHIITCWFNSLNYLIRDGDLARVFERCGDALVPSGWLLFDVYTLHGLEVEWADRAWVAVDEPDCFITTQTSYEMHTHIGKVHFTGFLR